MGSFVACFSFSAKAKVRNVAPVNGTPVVKEKCVTIYVKEGKLNKYLNKTSGLKLIRRLYY